METRSGNIDSGKVYDQSESKPACYSDMLFIKLSDEELLHYSDELVWVRPDEGVVSAIDDDELRTKHAVPERLRAVYWYRDHSSRQ